MAYLVLRASLTMNAGTDRSLKDVLRRRVAEGRDRRVFGTWADAGEVDAWMSFAELDAAARGIAARLQSASRAGERALLLYPPGFDYIAAFWGCLYADVIAVPVYPPDPARLDRTLPRLRAIIADAQATVVLTTRPIAQLFRSVAELAPDLRRLTWLTSDDAAAADDWREPRIDEERI